MSYRYSLHPATKTYITLSIFKALIYKIHASQTFSNLTNFIEKNINIYDIKYVFYENIFYNKSNRSTNLVP